MSLGTADRDLGRLEARMDAVEQDIAEMRADVKAIRTTLDEARGGWRTLALVAGAAGSAGAALSQIVHWLGVLPK